MPIVKIKKALTFCQGIYQSASCSILASRLDISRVNKAMMWVWKKGKLSVTIKMVSVIFCHCRQSNIGKKSSLFEKKGLFKTNLRRVPGSAPKSACEISSSPSTRMVVETLAVMSHLLGLGSTYCRNLFWFFEHL